jgi:hypothetical protein
MGAPHKRPDDPAAPIIKASELAEFDYCRRAWWLRHVKKVSPVAMSPAIKRGRAHHTAHYGQVQMTAILQWAGYLLLAGGVGLLLIVSCGGGG